MPLNTVINDFTTNFGNTPNGLSNPQYSSGISYVDNTSTPTAVVNIDNQHTQGEKDASSITQTKFISVDNGNGDPLVGGVTLLTHQPFINYEDLDDARLYTRFDFSDAQFLALDETTGELVPTSPRFQQSIPSVGSVNTQNLGSVAGGSSTTSFGGNNSSGGGGY